MRPLLCAPALLALALPAAPEDRGWIDLLPPGDLSAWRGKLDGWSHAERVELDPKAPRRLTATPGKGVVVNLPRGSARDLVSKQSFGDLELHVEFLIAQGSNSGVKFMGLYEIQILDSYGRKALTGDSCGGVYPRAELVPRYRYLDKGVPPRVNACKPAGEWQELHATFLAPRFDASGKKVANARLVRATLNGQLIHEGVELKWPTGHNWKRKEVAKGPLLLQGDHGPVAFRNVRVRPLPARD